jgi:LysM repeat protein
MLSRSIISRSTIVVLILISIVALPIGFTSARSNVQQSGELLANPNFEQPYEQAGSSDIFVANNWSAWYLTPDGTNYPTDCPENAPSTCVPYRIPVYRNTQPQDPKAPERARSGDSQSWGITYAVYIAGVYQRVTNITPGARLQFSAYLQGFNCSDQRGCYGSAGEYAHSYEPGDMRQRVGIDPTGDTNPFSPNIVWSSYQNPLDAFGLIQVQAVAQANAVTVFVWTAPNYPERYTINYVDDASLVVVGQGTVAPNNPTQQPAGTAQPIGTAGPIATIAPGSNTYTIQAGDGLFGIAIAHNLTLDQLLALNPGLTRDAILQIGQVINVGGAAPASTAQPTTAPTAAPTAASTAAPTTGGATTYTVKSGDTLSAIALQFNLTVDQLLAFNNITKDTALQVGQVLIVGAAPATATPEPTAAPTPEPTSAAPEPTSTPAVSASGVCLLAFNDDNDNGVRDNDEALVANVQFEVKGADGTAVAMYSSDGQQEPHCLKNLADGRYTVDATLPAGRKATTEVQWSLSLLSGTSVNVNIGSQVLPEATATPEVTATPIPTVVATQSSSNIFPLIAGIALVIIAGIIVFIGMRSRQRPA